MEHVLSQARRYTYDEQKMVLGVRTVSQSHVGSTLFKVSFQPVNTGRAPILPLETNGSDSFFLVTDLSYQIW